MRISAMNSWVVAPTSVLLWIFLCGCGPDSCTGGDKVDRLAMQLEGGCCEFSTAPTDSQPDDLCKVQATGPMRWVSHDGRECVRWAAECLSELGPGAVRAVPNLIAAVRSGPNNYDTGDGIIGVRDAIVKALGSTGDERVVPVLLDALENPQPVEAGPGAAGYASKEPIGEEAALTALGLLGPLARPAVPRILPFLNRPLTGTRDLRIVQGAAAALGTIRDPSAIPALIEALGRDQATPAVAAALGAFGPAAAAAVPALTRLIEVAPDRNGNGAIRRAIRDIAGRGRAAALPRSYEGTTMDILKLIQETARKLGVRLTGIHQDGPKEEISVELPSGVRVHTGFDKQVWLARRIVTGSVMVRRDGAVESSNPYEGLGQLRSRLDQALSR